ncbi:MAG: 16S rRNA methyltransferase [Planctomycetota bacterium]
MAPGDDELERVIAAVAESRRYRDIAPELTRRFAKQALIAARDDVAEAVKRTKRHLHQVFGAYLPTPPRYARLVAELRAAVETSADERDTEVRRVLSRAMQLHASTRERLPIIESFYRTIFARTGRPQRVMDVGCGLNPLATPWMELPADCHYHAIDIDAGMMQFIGATLTLLGVAHTSEVADALATPPTAAADVAFLLKTLPCFAQQEPDSGLALIQRLNAPMVVTSFPTRSLGGIKKGMEDHYARNFEASAAERGLHIDRMIFLGELVYVVQK